MFIAIEVTSFYSEVEVDAIRILGTLKIATYWSVHNNKIWISSTGAISSIHTQFTFLRIQYITSRALQNDSYTSFAMIRTKCRVYSVSLEHLTKACIFRRITLEIYCQVTVIIVLPK
jgi:hypothetical protein